ncbi:MAG: hypothetical protein ACXV3F_08520, partial [Frankiaceae bacterium]
MIITRPGKGGSKLSRNLVTVRIVASYVGNGVPAKAAKSRTPLGDLANSGIGVTYMPASLIYIPPALLHP